MDEAFLINGVLRSVMGGRGKKSRKALRHLTRGGSGLASSVMSHPTAWLTGLGVAWGIYETLNQGSTGSGGSMGAAGPVQGGAAGSPGSVPLPPLPNVGGAAASAPADEAMRLVWLAVSAANADGVVTDQERAAIVQQAKAAGVGDIVEQELQQRRPLTSITAGVVDPAQRATLYVLAFTILRADEQLNGAERIYLAQLANLLGLTPADVQRLEKDTGERIDALGDQGQLGG